MRATLGLMVVAVLSCAGPQRDTEPVLDAASRYSPADCPGLPNPETGPIEVAISIDTSASTGGPSGSDVDGDGEIGHLPARLSMGGGFSSDPGDTILAAEVAAVASLVAELASPERRFALVTYSGTSPSPGEGSNSPTASIPVLEAILVRIHNAGPGAGGQFSVGMRRAIEALESSSPRYGNPRRLALFLADSPVPRFGRGPNPKPDPDMRIEAERAIKNSIKFHTFGLDEAARAVPPHPLSRMASATGGEFTAIEDANTLFCKLLSSLVK